ncbi:MAG: vitamin K epoxide reductase family protein [Saonia sp.]
MLSKKKEPIAIILYELFKLLGIRITYGSIKEKLLQHPSFPSLFSITNTLTNFGIPNKAVRIQKEQLEHLETPFFATIQWDETVLVKTVNEDTIRYCSPSKGWMDMTISQFMEIWNHMVILVDTTVEIEEKKYVRKKNFENLLQLRLPVTIIVLLGLLSILIYEIGTTIILPFLFLKLLGFFIAVLLVLKEINSDTRFSFCRAGKKVSCDDVLNSPASKIFSWLSMTDLGFLYFVGTVLALVLSILVQTNTADTILFCLIFASFLALPYTIFSLVYQAFRVKKWCVLCLAIVAVLWGEAIFGYYYLTKFSLALIFHAKGILIFIFCLLLPGVAWLFLKKVFVKSSNYETLLYSYLRITNNLEVFRFLQQKGKEIDMDFQSQEIILGNTASQNSITVAINPHCPACGKEYKSILALLEKHPDFAKIIFRFVGSPYVRDDARFFASAMLISHYIKDKSNFKALLSAWFELGDLQSFVKKHPVKHNRVAEAILKHQYTWSEKVKIDITPTTFFNNKVLSEKYTLEQVKGILDMNS